MLRVSRRGRRVAGVERMHSRDVFQRQSAYCGHGGLLGLDGEVELLLLVDSRLWIPRVAVEMEGMLGEDGVLLVRRHRYGRDGAGLCVETGGIWAAVGYGAGVCVDRDHQRALQLERAGEDGGRGEGGVGGGSNRF